MDRLRNIFSKSRQPSVRGARKLAISFIGLIGLVSVLGEISGSGLFSIFGSLITATGGSAFALSLAVVTAELIYQILHRILETRARITKNYWPVATVSYAMEFFAIPALALVPNGGYVVALAVMVIHRVGRKLKLSPRNTIVYSVASFISESAASGPFDARRSLGIHDLLERLGSIIGPFFIYILSKSAGNIPPVKLYARSFLLMAIASIIGFVVLVYAREKFGQKGRIDRPFQQRLRSSQFNHNLFFFYLSAVFLYSAGFVDYTLVGYHLFKTGFDFKTIPLLYAIVMLSWSVSSYIVDYLFDKFEMGAVFFGSLATTLFTIPLFLNRSLSVVIIGSVLAGIALAVQESAIKPSVILLVPKQVRSRAFYLYGLLFGMGYIFGMLVMGWLYAGGPENLVRFSVISKLFASMMFFVVALIYYQRKKQIGN